MVVIDRRTTWKIALFFRLTWQLYKAIPKPPDQQEIYVLSIPLIPHHTLRRRRLSQGLPDLPRFERTGYSHHDERHLQAMKGCDFSARQVAGLFQLSRVWNPLRRYLVRHSFSPTTNSYCGYAGSGVTAFPCSGFKDCGAPVYHIDPLFDGTQSNTYRVLKCDECLHGSCDSNSECHMGMPYAEGSSWKAKEVTDSCYAGGLHEAALAEDITTNYGQRE